ncbi:MAG: ATP synthase F1 subunit gamma, partial [Candidatus Glassbacteria bacterium]|nr:ATP synthase F1 subunit gamma [Candidatus Glassbacteria bacterium]
MAKAREIKNRIVAVTKTRKITRTMEMVATSRLKKYQKVVLSSRPYSEALADVLGGLATSPEALAHPLMEKRAEVKNVALLVLSANRGLCGAFNNNICRTAQLLYHEFSGRRTGVKLFTSGKKGISYFRHRGYEAAWKDIELPDDQSVEKTRQLGRLLIEDFLCREVDQVHVVYCRFVSAGRQETATEQLLPLTAPAGPEREAVETDFIFEPSSTEIVNTLLPLFAQSSVYRMVVENVASEQAARRQAMKLATDNADEMITYLNRQ